ncbi:hypothetical protein RND81_09G065100 [Saponaria officinalis]|uniref:SWIM-type domain-containing protein n=1 Tax=Saponaria officinalis TaxID=3572 RepID=A0AAW1IIC8_SAPOF
MEAKCTCRLFERKGIFCRHIIWVFSGKGLKKIPQLYIARRWTKYAVGDELIDLITEPTEIGDGVDEKYIEIEKGDVEKLSTVIREFREKLAPSTEEVTSKHQELEMILGCTTTKDISILPPKHSKNKGSGKRMVSSKTKSIEINKKPKRMCNNCKQFAHHDKRNFPYPFVLNPSPSGELSGDRDLEEEESE